MPTIDEEPIMQSNESDLSQVFDFVHADNQLHTESRQFQGLDIDNHVPLLGTDTTAQETQDYSNFADWIPQWVQPVKPCDYCSARQLYCFMSFGSVTCKACDTLFRKCSFASGESVHDGVHDDVALSGFVDTLQVVPETDCLEQGGLTGLKSLKSKSRAVGSSARTNKSSSSPSDGNDKKVSRFSRDQVKILRSWFAAHSEYPYPNEHEKDMLEKETGLKQSQIITWLANTRRRNKIGKTARSSSPSLRDTAGGIQIATSEEARPWSDLNPFERWQHSPPENDPAPINAIADAVANSDFARPNTSSQDASSGRGHTSSSTSYSARRAPSISSRDTGRESNSLSTGSSAVFSQGSRTSFGSFNSFSSGVHGKRDRRRKRKTRAPLVLGDSSNEGSKKRIYQCTFCCDTFKSKYDWTRHEKTLHLSLEKWICHPLGATILDARTGEATCAYCGITNPDEAHSETHNHHQCSDKGLEARTFFRKDHLRQHLRLMHECELQPHMDLWKASMTYINSRCGFCTARFTTWPDRNEHLATHFKEGTQMSAWKGCRGFDPPVAANVTNAMPPYLIGSESKSPDPFTASNSEAWWNKVPISSLDTAKAAGLDINTETLSQNPDLESVGLTPHSANNILSNFRNPARATCWEVLTIALGRYVRTHFQKAPTTPITDKMLQSQARRILYDTDDDWETTAADNPEWLDLFKKAHSLGFIPDSLGGIGDTVPSDLESYGDLGMRIPFCVLLEQGVRPENLSLASAMLHDRARTADGSGYTSRSSLQSDAEQAARFETVREASGVAGVLGREVQTADYGPLGRNDSLTVCEMGLDGSVLDSTAMVRDQAIEDFDFNFDLSFDGITGVDLEL